MATGFYCPECGEYFGKDKEVSKLVDCGNCGETGIYNEYGDDEDLTDEELKEIRKIERKNRHY